MTREDFDLKKVNDWLDAHSALIATVFLAAVLIGGAFWMRSCQDKKGNMIEVGVTHSNAIDLTPAQIRSIESIGEWEFLAIADEEMIDTVRRRLFGRDRLVRIYRGTLHIGINLEECKEGWVLAHGDTVSVTLPGVRLLSDRFIDEARTRSFYESGDWSAAAKEALYHKAANAMKRRCLTPANMRKAEDNAREQFTSLFRSFGFNHFEIRFE